MALPRARRSRRFGPNGECQQFTKWEAIREWSFIGGLVSAQNTHKTVVIKDQEVNRVGRRSQDIVL